MEIGLLGLYNDPATRRGLFPEVLRPAGGLRCAEKGGRRGSLAAALALDCTILRKKKGVKGSEYGYA